MFIWKYTHSTMVVNFIIIGCIASAKSSNEDNEDVPEDQYEKIGRFEPANEEVHTEQSHGVHIISWRWDEYWNIIMYCFVIIVCGIIKLLFHHIPIISKHMPESSILILIGVVIGLIIYPPWEQTVLRLKSHPNDPLPRFTSFLFFNVLLPPIVLDSAYSLYDRDFLDNLGSVLVYAIIGTLFNIFSVGFSLYLVYYIGRLYYNLIKK